MEDILKLKNKNIVVMGVANEYSLAWGVAQSLYNTGANVIYTYRSDRSLKKLTDIINKNNLPQPLVVQCDANDDASIQNAFQQIGESVGAIHGIVHSVASSNKEDLRGDFINTSREGYAFAQDTSAYSLIAVAREAKPYMTEGGSIITMSYLGAERAVPGYNVMGVAKAALESSVKYLSLDLGKDNIRINAISAGPVKTISAKGVGSLNEIINKVEEVAPLKKKVTKEEVGDMSVAMLSHLSRGVTGEVVYVDSGFNILG